MCAFPHPFAQRQNNGFSARQMTVHLREFIPTGLEKLRGQTIGKAGLGAPYLRSVVNRLGQHPHGDTKHLLMTNDVSPIETLSEHCCSVKSIFYQIRNCLSSWKGTEKSGVEHSIENLQAAAQLPGKMGGSSHNHGNEIEKFRLDHNNEKICTPDGNPERNRSKAKNVPSGSSAFESARNRAGIISVN